MNITEGPFKTIRPQAIALSCEASSDPHLTVRLSNILERAVNALELLGEMQMHFAHHSQCLEQQNVQLQQAEKSLGNASRDERAEWHKLLAENQRLKEKGDDLRLEADKLETSRVDYSRQFEIRCQLGQIEKNLKLQAAEIEKKRPAHQMPADLQDSANQLRQNLQETARDVRIVEGLQRFMESVWIKKMPIAVFDREACSPEDYQAIKEQIILLRDPEPDSAQTKRAVKTGLQSIINFTGDQISYTSRVAEFFDHFGNSTSVACLRAQRVMEDIKTIGYEMRRMARGLANRASPPNELVDWFNFASKHLINPLAPQAKLPVAVLRSALDRAMVVVC